MNIDVLKVQDNELSQLGPNILLAFRFEWLLQNDKLNLSLTLKRKANIMFIVGDI